MLALSQTKTNFLNTDFTAKQTPSNLFKTTEEWKKVTQESYDANILHLEEGRHSGYTLHGYFDGHAEMLSAATVGKLQTQQPTGDWIKYLTGPYGDPTIAGEWK